MNEIQRKPRGGKRENAGRPKLYGGDLRDVREFARQYANKAFDTLERVMLRSRSDTAKVAAAKEILDRAYGKSTQMAVLDVNVHDETDALQRGRARIAAMRAGLELVGAETPMPDDALTIEHEPLEEDSISCADNHSQPADDCSNNDQT